MTRLCHTEHDRSDFAMKRTGMPTFPGSRILLRIALCGLAASPLPAQETEWQEAHHQIQDLNDAARYSESLPLAIRNLQYAKDTFGLNQPNTATSLEVVTLEA